MKKRVAVLQPIYPHYRKPFFEGLRTKFDMSFYNYDKTSKNFKIDQNFSKLLLNVHFKGFLLYSIFPFLRKDISVLLLSLHPGHLSTWFLLLTKHIHKKEIVLFGHGISIKRYIKEIEKPSLALRFMIWMADKVWLYTPKERDLWKSIFPHKIIVSINNTIPNAEEIARSKNFLDVNQLKKKYEINQEVCFLICVRFNNPFRRIDILLDAIDVLDKQQFGFIIIGEGSLKPDFSVYPNVYDFGEVYDNTLKRELFSVANFYFQPAWVGLSIVEALAYGLPVITFYRSPHILQCVEYYYLKNDSNALIFEDFESFCSFFENFDLDHFPFNDYRSNAIKKVLKDLTLKVMIDRAAENLVNE